MNSYRVTYKGMELVIVAASQYAAARWFCSIKEINTREVMVKDLKIKQVAPVF